MKPNGDEKKYTGSNDPGGCGTNMTMPELAAASFAVPGERIAVVEPYGQGIIHDTYLVKLSSRTGQFILQRINTSVFKKPELIIHNLQMVSRHMQERRKLAGGKISTEWQILHVLPAKDGRNFFNDPEGGFWRALPFIQGASSLERITCNKDALEVGRALGTFHWLLSDLDTELLHETLPGFHNMELYLKQYDAVLDRKRQACKVGRSCQEFIADRRGWAPVLEEARRSEILRLHIIHGDPKINNIMVDNRTGKAVSLIDLDTVMPGLVQYDVGDCLRSCCNTWGEDTADIAGVRFDLDLCRVVLTGYMEMAGCFLTEKDLGFFFDAIRLIPFELGLRFYTDFLAGNVYFKVSAAKQNLERAMVQFKLVQSIEDQEEKIREIIEENRAALFHCKPR